MTKTNDVMSYIEQYKKDNDGLSPSYRDIGDNCNMPSPSHVHWVIGQLEKDGLIKRLARGIKIVGGKWSRDVDKA